jgi:excisionase family DNA binding protein
MSNQQVLTTEEVAERLRVSARTVTNLITKGDLPAFRVGRAWRVQTDHLAEYVKATGTNAYAEYVEKLGDLAFMESEPTPAQVEERKRLTNAVAQLEGVDQ